MAAGYTKPLLAEPQHLGISDAGNILNANQAKSVTCDKMCYQAPYLMKNLPYNAKFRYLFTFYSFV
jgi:hypothetical protein